MHPLRYWLLALIAVAATFAASVSAHAPGSICGPLELAPGKLVSEKTGQHTATFVVMNRSRHSCVFKGYPRVELRDERGRVLRFRYHDGGDQMITGRPPQRVTAGPGRRVFFALNKYRCDLRATAIARSVRVLLPGQSTWLRLRLPAYPLLDYCREKPSLIVSVSPVTTTLAATAATR